MNDGIILTLAYPETIVPHAQEWYSPFLRFLYIGNRNYVRAGHAALVLIEKSTGNFDYYDFGRYITSLPHGRVRSKEIDFELNFPITAQVENDQIVNLEAILKFLATHPQLTHGDGHLYASVCNAIDYQKAKTYITTIQNQGFVRYAAFIKKASNCARFVTDSLIESVTNPSIKSRLIKSKRFTPSTIGNVVLGDTENHVYVVSEAGEISAFDSTVRKENRRLFLDSLKTYKPDRIGKLVPQENDIKESHAQWLGGIGTGAWFELYDLNDSNQFRYRRVSPYGNVDCDAVYSVVSEGFNIQLDYRFVHYSNCQFFHVEQNNKTYRFEYLKDYKN